MKNHLTITIENNQFVVSETKTVIENNVLSKTGDFKELVEIVKAAGYKTAKFSDEAKIFKADLIKKQKALGNVKRQEREAKRKERKIAQIAKLEEKLAKLKSA